MKNLNFDINKGFAPNGDAGTLCSSSEASGW